MFTLSLPHEHRAAGRVPRLSGVLLVAAAVAAPVSAQDRAWVTPTGGRFVNPVNWNGGVVPGPGETAVFDLGATYLVACERDAAVGGFRVPGDEGTPALHGHVFTLE